MRSRGWVGVAVVCVAAAANPAEPRLHLKSAELAYGPLGPSRVTDDVYPGEKVFVRLRAGGVRADADGRADLFLTLKLTGADGGETVKEIDLPFPVRFGGGEVPLDPFVRFTSEPPGAYRVSVTVRDRAAGAEAAFERTVTLKPARFMLQNPRFYLDDEGKVPAPAGGFVGQFLSLRFDAAGVTADAAGRVRLGVTSEVVDEDGAAVGPPRTQKFEAAAEPGKTPHLSTGLPLTRAGTFRLRLTLADEVGGRACQVEVPLAVREP